MPVTPSKKDPLLATLPPFESFLQTIDLDKVAAAISPPGVKMPEWDVKEIKSLVWSAAAHYLPRDLADMQITGVEEPYDAELDFGRGPRVFRGIKDLRGVLRGRLNVTKRHAGKKVVIDWKTTHKTLDKDWDARLLDSWQWKKYLYFDNADVMLYRGLAINSDGEFKTRELIIERPANLADNILVQLNGVSAQRDALVAAGLTVYPRRMPFSCGAFGRECAYFADCRQDTMPRVALEPGLTFSYSSMDKFLMCPERYRRGVISTETEDTEESLYGQAVHRGLADVYQQAKDKLQPQ